MKESGGLAVTPCGMQSSLEAFLAKLNGVERRMVVWVSRQGCSRTGVCPVLADLVAGEMKGRHPPP